MGSKKEYQHRWYLKNKEKVLIQSKEYYLKNREKYLKLNRENHLRNREKYNSANRKRYLEYRKEWYEWLKSIGYDKCSNPQCGYDKCFAAIDFHHVNPEEKEHQIGKIMKFPITEERKKEVLKTIPLCSNCHRELHNE